MKECDGSCNASPSSPIMKGPVASAAGKSVGKYPSAPKGLRRTQRTTSPIGTTSFPVAQGQWLVSLGE